MAVISVLIKLIKSREIAIIEYWCYLVFVFKDGFIWEVVVRVYFVSTHTLDHLVSKGS